MKKSLEKFTRSTRRLYEDGYSFFINFFFINDSNFKIQLGFVFVTSRASPVVMDLNPDAEDLKNDN